MKENFEDKYFIHNLVFYKGSQSYGLNYFSNLDELIDYCPFELLGKVSGDYEDSIFIETSAIFKIYKITSNFLKI